MNYDSTAHAVSQLKSRLSGQPTTPPRDQSPLTPQVIELRHISENDLHRLELIAKFIDTGKKATSPVIHRKLPGSVKPKNEASTSESLRQLSQDNSKGLSVPLLYREKTGDYGAFEYELADGLTLQDIIEEKKRRKLELLDSSIFSDENTHEVQDELETTNEETVADIEGNLKGDQEAKDVQESINSDSTDNNDLAQEIAKLSQVVGRLIQEIKLLKVENEALKANNHHLEQEFQKKFSALESKINQPRPSSSVEGMLDELLSVSINGKNGGTH
ncbi:hypothetical protein [Limnoraphis robusta]|uniref:hypothetical protein n=1 Tax=Limnoraphis robusta TaxID=1118279 RepID=UPI002B1EFC47|nr:hypothetical protein [Limnoraphis robusta]MEA5499543.1 hypothetical protein [Limnoraphis robusta BA-68 BA1]